MQVWIKKIKVSWTVIYSFPIRSKIPEKVQTKIYSKDFLLNIHNNILFIKKSIGIDFKIPLLIITGSKTKRRNRHRGLQLYQTILQNSWHQHARTTEGILVADPIENRRKYTKASTTWTETINPSLKVLKMPSNHLYSTTYPIILQVLLERPLHGFLHFLETIFCYRQQVIQFVRNILNAQQNLSSRFGCVD